MRLPLFHHILFVVEVYEPYFVQRRDNAGRFGLTSLQKIIATLQMLVYGIIGDLVDEYLKNGETIAVMSLKLFIKAVVSIFSIEYLRSPTNHDITRLLAIGQSRSFLGMLGSIDCMY
jgi:hypothetical protein